ncbi:low temperature requirement protein A [Streptomyces sp. NPDC040750]|uniref:alpha/beta fold hydrolase n=1 Tax=Streptomyces sp. NPDC040750 TaxID=3154491 RepID=UPI0033EB54BE
MSETAAICQSAAIAKDATIPFEQVRTDLASIRRPVLYATGVQDVMIPASAAYTAVQHLPNATLAAYSDAGHAFLFQPLSARQGLRRPGHGLPWSTFRSASRDDVSVSGSVGGRPALSDIAPRPVQRGALVELTSDPARREVTPLKSFFDLVHVFAIGRLSHQLLAHPTRTGAAQTLVLYLAVYAAWAYTP